MAKAKAKKTTRKATKIADDKSTTCAKNIRRELIVAAHKKQAIRREETDEREAKLKEKISTDMAINKRAMAGLPPLPLVEEK